MSNNKTNISVVVVITILIAIAGIAFTSYSAGQKSQDDCIKDNTAKIIEVRSDVAALKKDIEYIREKVDENKQVQSKILDKIDELKDTIKDN